MIARNFTLQTKPSTLIVKRLLTRPHPHYLSCYSNYLLDLAGHSTYLVTAVEVDSLKPVLVLLAAIQFYLSVFFPKQVRLKRRVLPAKATLRLLSVTPFPPSSRRPTLTVRMAWSPDFCLACDRQTTGGVYCSQACRLADLEHASPRSEPVSPIRPARLDPEPTSSASPQSGSIVGFYLPSPVEFDAYRTRRSTQLTSNGASSHSRPQTTTSWVGRGTGQSATQTRPTDTQESSALTPSSSQSSLVSLQSSPDQNDDRLSDQARNALRAYVTSFDRTRDWRRRTTWSGR